MPSPAAAAGAPSPLPNIVQIVWHDLGDWLGCYGHAAVRSPSLDRLAAQGVLFERYFATAPLCSPSRASMLTGLMPHATGVTGIVRRGFDMDRSMVPLPQLLKRAGYATTLIGLQHECLDPRWEGYDEVIGERSSATYVADQAEAFLARHARTGPAPRPAHAGRQPFFLAIGTHDVHRPHGTAYDPAILRELQDHPVPPYLPDHDVSRLDLAIFFSRIQEADRQMGRILDALDRAGLADDTLVVFTTEHGAQIPRAKITPYDPGLEIALLMRWPGRLRPGTRVEALLSNLDYLPTLCDLIGIPPPEGLHGRSFAGLLTDGAYEPRSEVFAELTWATHYRPVRAIRTERHKFIVNYEPGLPVHIGGGDINRYGPELIEARYGTPLPAEELYLLEEDPYELRNLVDDPVQAGVREDLRRRLRGWLEATDDPILRGPVPNPDPSNTHLPIWVPDGDRFVLRRPSYWQTAEP